jgi:hypothetical protein
MNMMISTGWLILTFALGTYVGIMLLAALVVSSREPAQTDAEKLRDDPTLAELAAEWRAEEAAIRPNSGLPAL